MRRIFGFLFALFAVLNPALAEQLDAAAIVEQLRQGGHVIYLRHAHTDLAQAEMGAVSLDDCATQRNLDAQGRAEAQAIGKVFKRYKIPLGKILSSPYCRARDTATLAFGRMEIDPNLSFSITKNQAETEHLAQALKHMLAETPPAGVNTVLVSHSGNLKDATGIWPKPEGAMAVFKPDQQGGFEYLGMVPPDFWPGVMNAR